jgi:hypothetical protein
MRFLTRSYAILIFAFVISSFQRPAFACSPGTCNIRPEYASFRIASDLDGDQKVDIADGRFSGTSFSVTVSLTAYPQHTRLSVPVLDPAGHELIAYDLDRDQRTDLILIGPSSIEPVAVWLNRGNGTFERSSRHFAVLFGAEDGARFCRRTTQNETQSAIPTGGSLHDLGSFADIAVDLVSRSLGHLDRPDFPLTMRESRSTSPRSPPACSLRAI